MGDECEVRRGDLRGEAVCEDNDGEVDRRVVAREDKSDGGGGYGDGRDTGGGGGERVGCILWRRESDGGVQGTGGGCQVGQGEGKGDTSGGGNELVALYHACFLSNYRQLHDTCPYRF